MHRRRFIALLGAAITAARTLRAQQKAMPVVGALYAGSPPANLGDLLRGPAHQGMSEMGFVEGTNMVWEYRWADFHFDRLPALAADLISRKVDLIIAFGGGPVASAAKNATSIIPIVFSAVGDPVGFGLVASLARPGGNLTGVSNFNVELIPKRFELLCELAPQAAVIALLVSPGHSIVEGVIRNAQEAARAKGVQLHVLKATTEAEIDAAFAAFEQLQAGGVLVPDDPFFFGRREQLVALAARYAVPTIYPNPGFVVTGGLISYSADIDVLLRETGIYAARILKGEKPADLPVQQPTIFKLAVNLKTAKALGLTIPPSILARADEVIE